MKLRPQDLLRSLQNNRVLVIGDVMIDHHFYVHPADLKDHQTHTGTEVVWAASGSRGETLMPGGAARVAAAASSLGARVTCVGAVGDDWRAAQLRGLLTAWNVIESFVVSPSRPTTLKLRVYHRGDSPDDSSVITRVDEESTEVIPLDTQQHIVQVVTKTIGDADIVIMDDYDKGLLAPTLVSEVGLLAEEYDKPLVVDPKFQWQKYRGLEIAAVVPNYREFCRGVLSADPQPDKVRPDKAEIERAVELWPNVRSWMVTCGQNGSSVWWQQNPDEWFHVKTYFISALSSRPHHVPGCGPSNTASYALGLSSHRDPLKAALLATLVAGCQATTEFDQLVTTEQIRSQATLPVERDEGDAWSESVGSAVQALISIGDCYEIREVFPGVVLDGKDLLSAFIRKLDQFFQSSTEDHLLVIGQPGSGKTHVTKNMLKARGIAVEDSPATGMLADIPGRLRAFLLSPKSVLLLDEYVSVETQFRPYTGALAEGRLTLADTELTIRPKKILALGSCRNFDELSQDLKRRFQGALVEFPQLNSPFDRLDVFALSILNEISSGLDGRLLEVVVKRAVLGAFMMKAQAEKLTPGLIGGVAAELCKAHSNRGKDPVGWESWHDAGLGDSWYKKAIDVVAADPVIILRRVPSLKS